MKASLKSRTEFKGKRETQDDTWKKELEALRINDEHWWCMITMIVETLPEHSQYVSMLNEAAESERRKSVHLLNARQLLASIKTLSKVELDRCPTVQGVCHYANKFLSEEEGPLPTWLLARTIKFLVYRAKAENVTRARREMILRHDIEMENQHMQMVGSPGVTGATQQRKRTPATDTYVNSKANTRLRKRDEEWREKVYIDDAPEDGPNLYVVLLGFYDPELPLELIKLGVPLTAVLKVKRPEDVIEFDRDDGDAERKAKVSAGTGSGKLGLVRFWDEFEKRINDPDNTLDYCCLMRRTFCPPVISPLDTKSRYESAKADLYDRLSYIVYDLYDVYRQHISYVRSMKLQSGIVEVGKREQGDMKTYRMILNSLPAEAVIVPIILDAIIAQVVEDDLGCGTSNLIGNLDNSSVHFKRTSPMDERGRIKDFLGKRNEVTYEDEKEKGEARRIEETSDYRLILRGDDFTLINYLADAKNGIFSPTEERVSFILKMSKTLENILRNSEVARIWKNFQELSRDTLRMYKYHMEKLGRCFASESMDTESVYHYINLMIFDKIISQSDTVKCNKKNDKSQGINSLSDVLSRDAKCKSISDYNISYFRDDFLFSKINTLTRSSSDGRIDYGKSMDKTFECIPLISLINPLEMFETELSKKRKFQTTEGPSLGEFDSVELLSPSIFLQKVYNCLRHFSEYQYAYCQLTDSVLLHFYHTYVPEGVFEKRKSASIPTPVCLRDFCNYIVHEKLDWLQGTEDKQENETRSSKDIISKLKQKHAEETKTYTKDFQGFSDEDFILSSSLKAKGINKTRNPVPIRGTELKSKKKVNSTSKESKEIKVRSLGEEPESREKKFDKKLMESETSFLPRRRILEARCAKDEDPYDFIGYDLGSTRIEISSIEKHFFSKDGTSVRVYREEWLNRKAELHVTIKYPECSLKLCHVPNGPSSHTYHLMTKDDVIMAFSRDEHCHKGNSSEVIAKKITTHFRASFPSGLLIEPAITDNTETPLYVKQRYVSKEQNSLETSEREACRKFLKNGTVLKFLANGAVIVLRPNGTIVNCHSFTRIEKQKYVDRTVSKSKNDSNLSVNNKSKRKESYAGKLRHRPVTEEDHLSKISILTDDQANSRADSSNSNDFRISHYTVSDHDGSHYEVSNDRIIRQFDRSIVRSQSDYEIDETFIRRADGTNMLLDSKGELTALFTDGTRIVTGYVIESESIICDWTVQEFEIFFGKDLDMARTLTQDSFVLVTLTCRFEHKNYATVMYDQSTLRCTLLMPNDVEVTISADGRYDIKVDSVVALKIDKGQLEFSKRICQACQGTSTSIYNFHRSEIIDRDDLTGSLLRTEDMFENVFIVNWDGTTEYKKTVSKSDHLCVPRDDLTLRSSCRMFAMKRDLSGFEYQHKSVLIGQDNEAATDKDISVFRCPVPARSKLSYSISMTPWTEQIFSKKSLRSCHISQLRPTNYERGHHILRSTYSIPYDWLFPFGNNGNGIFANTWNFPLKKYMEKKISPDFFIIRLLRQIKQKDDNIVINLRKALNRYFYTMINEFGEYRSYVAKDQRTEFQAKLENDLTGICLGYQRIISQEYFKGGLLAKLNFDSTKQKIPKTIDHAKAHKKHRMNKDEIEWYLKCKREKTKIPYFHLANGACFLWLNNCLDEIFHFMPNQEISTENS